MNQILLYFLPVTKSAVANIDEGKAVSALGIWGRGGIAPLTHKQEL
jgi:hypothetical protein